MRRSLALLLVVIFSFTAFMLAGCKKKDENSSETGPEAYKEKYNYSAYVSLGSEIVGNWTEKLSADSKVDKTVWIFDKNTTLNITEKVGNVSMSTICAYNYNEKKGELSYLILDSRTEVKVNVSIEGDTMTFTNNSGAVVRTFTR